MDPIEVSQSPYTRFSAQIETLGATLLTVLNSGDKRSFSRALEGLTLALNSADSTKIDSAWKVLGPLLSSTANRYEDSKGHFFVIRRAYTAFRAELSNQAPASAQETPPVMPVRVKMGGRVASTLNS